MSEASRIASPSPVIGALWGIGGPATQSLERPDMERVSVSPSPRDLVFDMTAMQDNPGAPPVAGMFRNEGEMTPPPVLLTPAVMPERNLYKEIERIEQEEEEEEQRQPAHAPVHYQQAVVAPAVSPAQLSPCPLPTTQLISPAPKQSKSKRSKSTGGASKRSTSKGQGSKRVTRSDTAASTAQRTGRTSTPPAAKARQGEAASARLAISHTARSYQLEKQTIIHKHEEELREMKMKYEDETKGLRKTIAKMHAEFATRRGVEISYIRGKLSDSNDEAEATKIALQHAAEENLALEEELQAMQTKAQALEAMREDDKQRVMATLENWKAHYGKIEAANNEEITALRDRTTEQEGALVSFNHMKQQLMRAEEEAEKLSKQLEMCNLQLEQSNKRAMESSTVMETMSVHQQEAMEGKASIESLQNTVAGLQRSNAVFQEERAALEAKVREMQAEVTRRIASEALLQEELSNSKCQVTADKLKEIELSGRQSVFQSELQASHSRENMQHKEKEVLRSQILDLTTKMHNSDAALQASSLLAQQLALENERLRDLLVAPSHSPQACL